ncbi:RNA polymerase sigma factor [Prevotella sp.]|uniref:RNA polymerase sigma factor n=1 Tax=Prevotella sp. TaxID=59823 RepID=UPI001CB5D61E|nr:RNA polymerase sigma factor [Prevotella sp.]MBF1640053.1 RNA polymerase sigma factor [Prevotella sp.]
MKKVSFRNDVLPLKNEIFRLALRITLNRAEAEDIVQDTLIKVWNHRYEWENIDSIEAFSLTVCRNLSLDRIKKKENNNDSLEDVKVAEPLASSNPQDRMIEEDKISLVKQIVDALPEKQRSCMQLRDFEGKSYKEIAEILEISEEQVKVNIFRARQTVKQKYLKLDNYGL